MRAERVAEHQKRPRVVGRFCFIWQGQKPVRMGDDGGNANPAQRQEKRAARLCAIQNIGQPRRGGLRGAGALDLRGKGAERRVAIGHALADGLRGSQRAGGFMRVKRRRREIGKERKHSPRGFVRLQKAEHAAAAGDEHRRAGGGMIDRRGKRFPRKAQKPRAFGVAERDALGFREIQRAEQRRRGTSGAQETSAGQKSAAENCPASDAGEKLAAANADGACPWASSAATVCMGKSG